MTNAYLATVHLLLPLDVQSDAEAADAVSGLLTEGGIYENALLDWTYGKGPEGSYAHAVEVQIPDDYDRDAFDLHTLAASVQRLPASPLRDAAPAMRDALAKMTVWRPYLTKHMDEADKAAWAEGSAALALAGGATVSQTPAKPDWRAIAAALLPYAESRAEDMGDCADALADDAENFDIDDKPGLATVREKRDEARAAADKAVAAVDAAKALLASLDAA